MGNEPYFLQILRQFLASSGEYNSFYASKNERSVSKYSTIDQLPFVTAANAHIDTMYSKGKRVGDGFFLALSVFLSQANIEQHHGGPFGAVIVEFEDGLDAHGKGLGKPRVIGVGTNHVVPHHDPCAHTEIEALRDAAKRQDFSDVRGCVLYTSCECCPMCLSVANGSGISRIVSVNTRGQAGAIGFSDQLQYDLFRLPPHQHMTWMNRLEEGKRQDLLDKLSEHGAMVLDHKGDVFAYGDVDTSRDPTGIASINAVRKAVKKHADHQKQKGNQEPVFCSPDGWTLVSRDIPQPSDLILADWARMLRHRDHANPENPAFDGKTPDPLRILHVTMTYEQLPVMDRHGCVHVHQDAHVTYQQPTLPDALRAVLTQHSRGRVVSSAAQEVFQAWKDGTREGKQVRY